MRAAPTPPYGATSANRGGSAGMVASHRKPHAGMVERHCITTKRTARPIKAGQKGRPSVLPHCGPVDGKRQSLTDYRCKTGQGGGWNVDPDLLAGDTA
jgi:hypothetical protein